MKRPTRKRKKYTRRRHNQHIKKRWQWFSGGLAGLALAWFIGDSDPVAVTVVVVVSAALLAMAVNWW